MGRLQMRGPIVGRQAIADWLTANLPNVLGELRLEWGLSIEQLPDPLRLVPHEADNLDRWPTVAVTTGIEATTRRIENDPNGAEFVTSYPVEVYAWINAEGREAAYAMRDDYATALKVALLEHPTFGRTEQDMLLEESTFIQRFSDLQHVKGDRYVAGSLSAFDLHVVERLGIYGSRTSATVDTVVVRGYSEGMTAVPSNDGATSSFISAQVELLPHPALD